MCGITGIVGTSANSGLIGVMLAAQQHRGPDFTGSHNIENEISLGHNRLSIIDLSAEANQPFISGCGNFIMVFNGEIYNYIELRELLPEYDFKTNSDTEVLMAAFIKWGSACLDKLNGMFSFAIWDKEAKKLFAARDRFGVKPFYYSHFNDSFFFSSEIKTLHAAGIPAIPNKAVWASYFAYGSYGDTDESFWTGVRQLPGGHFLSYDNGALQVEKWYDFEKAIESQPRNLSFEQAEKRYAMLLKDSIRLRFRADVPVGFNISGGLDSSVLLAMVQLEQGNDNIRAYTFYTGDSRYDELPWVEGMIALTGNPLVKEKLSASEVPALADKIHYFQDEPYGGIPTLAYSKLFEKARADGTIVLLDGQGMDEQWAGYDYYTKDNDHTIQATDNPFRQHMLADDFLQMAKKPNYPQPFPDEVQNKQYRDLFYTKLPRALRFNDRVSMAYGTELREPFLDYRLVELAFALPLEYKIKDGISKYMLREIASAYLDANLVFAPKRPLQTPQREWLAEDLISWVSDNFKDIENSEFATWFDVPQLQNELQLYRDGHIQSAFHIWQCLSLSGLLIKK
ncbi:asparagine synthase (glutamine-hydrolyzing) [Flavobacterium pallidum]|uniref:asparagine synthase (glutamine-hydrolyzing) n=1 Tax=Flavobacterium pallidum TaxID=2172098 RepID=A0A2S1SH10_9FLAO|nr:asparagine synthase (glutamine-hydrolyzing) [Flavobacterium pallidum]AWI25665.1 asparagine synthase (glutamine-hydrolyzing) [Flavobacterium pallidum]